MCTCSWSSPQSLVWSYGYDKDLVGGVQSLGEECAPNKSLFFVSGTTGVIFTHDDSGTRTQKLLQGHVNAITGVVISSDKKRIVTADSGKDSLLVVWDAETATPVKTIFRPHPTGVAAVDITPDSRFIVSLSSPIPRELIVEADEEGTSQWAPGAPGSGDFAGPAGARRRAAEDDRRSDKREYRSGAPEASDRLAPETTANTERSSHSSLSFQSAEKTGRSTQSSQQGPDGSQPSARSSQPATNAAQTERTNQHTYQSVAVWDWRAPGNTPISVAVIATPDVQHTVLFNSTDVHEVLTNGKRRAFFWFWEETTDYFHFYSPALQAKDFKQKIGDFTRSIFLPNSTKAATGTADGDVVLWDLSLIVDGLSRPDERRAVRILNLSRAALTYLFVHEENWIVAGFADGTIHFYDFQFRISRWFDGINAGPVNSISFDYKPTTGSGFTLPGKKDVFPQSEDANIPPFIFSTANAAIVHVTPRAPSAGDGWLWKNQWNHETIFQGLDAAPRGMAAHPNLPLIAVCGASGYLKLWNYETHRLVVSHWFDKLAPTVVAFSGDGILMGVGFGNGQVKIYALSEERLRALARREDEAVDRRTLAATTKNTHATKNALKAATASTKKPVEAPAAADAGHEYDSGKSGAESAMVELLSSKESREAVTHFCFSEDCGHLAVAQGDRCICLYKLGYRMGDTSLPLEWLFSGLIISSATVIEQEAVPTGCLAVQPEDTTLAPMHGGILSCVEEVSYRYKTKKRQPASGLQDEGSRPPPEEEEVDQQFLAFACEERLVGLIQKPLDGNPYKVMSMVAHPREIPSFAVERLQSKINKDFVFTCGGTDFTICQWRLNPPVLMANAQRGGQGTQPFNDLIPGGVDGDFYRNMKDYFYYCQIRSQGERTTKSRKLDGTVPLTELANLLCAVGECPSNMDIQNLISECTSTLADTQPIASGATKRAFAKRQRKVSFEQFLQCYVNHRAAVSVGYEEVVSALRVLQKKNHNTPLTPEVLMHILSKTLCGTKSLAEALGSPVIDEDMFARQVLLLQPVRELCVDCDAGEES
ncbi:hypothetical protein BESB_063170 [Besnoitia besnoiti]|uniref:Cilia- and flagella-associated protein 251 n=1 Tax=Besnoitia besnoiti TaxID=94643 RepID=A0A2A9MJ54_BESBE|nr:hypothetical protein BESB_063170 [Besnoitia besnoiti]PFH35430.1 hypothetical protein BESB_063170 [Besnoitia besnoiti]